MSNRTIRVLIDKQPDLYDELLSTAMTHTEYEGCYVTQFSEFPVDGQMTAEFILRECDGQSPE